MKSQFSYKTDEERIKILKIKALDLGIPVNEILDNLIDYYLDILIRDRLVTRPTKGRG